jgi:hypothetical protein
MANIVTIQAKDLKKMQGRLTKAQRAVVEIATEEMENYGKELTDALKDEVPVRTGELQRSIRYEVLNQGRRDVVLRVDMGNTKRPDVVIKSLNYGSLPHVIRPKRGKFLRFQWKGKMVFARKVNHPGTTRDPFIYRAEKKADSARRRMIARIGSLLVSKIEDGK